MSYRQSYNGGSRACWLLFTRLSLAPVDPPASLIRHPRHLSLPRAADRPLSIGQHFDRTTHAAQSSFSHGVSRRAQIDGSGNAKIDYDRSGRELHAVNSKSPSIYQSSLFDIRENWASRGHLWQNEDPSTYITAQICHGMRTFTVRSPQTVQNCYRICKMQLHARQRCLDSLHWLKVNERIEYKLLSLTYKVLTTAQPSYLLWQWLGLVLRVLGSWQ